MVKDYMLDLEKAMEYSPAAVVHEMEKGEEQQNLIPAAQLVETRAAVEESESALLEGQEGGDLEAGGLEAPSLEHQASEVTEEQANMGLIRHRLCFQRANTGERSVPSPAQPKDAKERLSDNPSLIAACASSFMSLISGIGLAIDTMQQMTTSPSPPRSWWSKLFLFLSIAFITSTVISIIVSFLPKTYYYLPMMLMPAFLVLGVSFYDGRRNHVGDDDTDSDKRDRSFQLAMNMTGFSFAGAVGTIIGYHKNYSNRADHFYVSVSIYLMLAATITGLLVLQLSRLRIHWKKAALVNAIMLILLVVGVLVVATTFLGGLLAGTLFPVAVAAAVWYFFEYRVPRGRRDQLDAALSREEELKLLHSPVATGAMSVSFGAVMTTFSGFLGGEAKGCSLEVFMFFVVSCFVSSVTLGVITFWNPKKASLGAAARALACITLVLFVLAGLAMVSYVG